MPGEACEADDTNSDMISAAEGRCRGGEAASEQVLNGPLNATPGTRGLHLTLFMSLTYHNGIVHCGGGRHDGPARRGCCRSGGTLLQAVHRRYRGREQDR